MLRAQYWKRKLPRRPRASAPPAPRPSALRGRAARSAGGRTCHTGFKAGRTTGSSPCIHFIHSVMYVRCLNWKLCSGEASENLLFWARSSAETTLRAPELSFPLPDLNLAAPLLKKFATSQYASILTKPLARAAEKFAGWDGRWSAGTASRAPIPHYAQLDFSEGNSAKNERSR